MSDISLIGAQLREHRKNRGMSQLQLAGSSGSTSRYISFIETGRSRPGRNVILKLSEALNLTMRDSNELLVAAGLPAEFTENPLSDKDMEPVQRILKQVLKNHNPFPAWAIGPGLRFIDSNTAAERVFPGMVGMEPRDLIDLWCTPSGFLSEEERVKTVFQTIRFLRHERFHFPHPDLAELIRHAESYAEDLGSSPLLSDSPVMCPTLNLHGKEVRTLTTVMRFDKVVNITMAEIRVELVYPADDESEAIFRALAI